MKRLTTLVLFSTLLVFNIQAQTDLEQVKADSLPFKEDSISIVSIEKSIIVEGEVFAKPIDTYKIYPTTNMYNFLMLDTCSGKIWRIQWNLDSNKRFRTVVSDENLIAPSYEEIIGRFEIYPTQNIYNFILLDKFNGRTWQFQWGFDKDKNWIARIW